MEARAGAVQFTVSNDLARGGTVSRSIAFRNIPGLSVPPSAVIPTTDHDAGPPPLYGAPHSVLVPVLIDGHRWAMIPPGDPIAAYLVGAKVA